MRPVITPKALWWVITNNPEGFSMNIEDLSTEAPKNGYMVGITHGVVASEADVARLLPALEGVFQLVNVPPGSLFLGGWLSGSGMYCLDASVWVAEAYQAVVLGQVFHQEAYYDCNTKLCVNVE